MQGEEGAVLTLGLGSLAQPASVPIIIALPTIRSTVPRMVALDPVFHRPTR
jgi:hypothetical protein